MFDSLEFKEESGMLNIKCVPLLKKETISVYLAV
jgi:hypothetical protein